VVIAWIIVPQSVPVGLADPQERGIFGILSSLRPGPGSSGFLSGKPVHFLLFLKFLKKGSKQVKYIHWVFSKILWIIWKKGIV
jgi:hypothetical protein